jgi:hypothetical protein
MDGLSLKIKTSDGVDSVFSLRPRTIVAFEQKFGKGLAKLFAEDQKMEHIYFLAWQSLKDNGRVVKPFGPEFLDTLESVEMISDPNSESTAIA